MDGKHLLATVLIVIRRRRTSSTGRGDLLLVKRLSSKLDERLTSQLVKLASSC